MVLNNGVHNHYKHYANKEEKTMKRFSAIIFSMMLFFSLMIFGENIPVVEAAGKHFEDVSIVFFPGGSEGGPLLQSSIGVPKPLRKTLGVK